MTLTLKSTPIVAVRAAMENLKHQHSPISECSKPRDGRRRDAIEARTRSLVRGEERLVREPEQQGRFPDAGCTCFHKNEVLLSVFAEDDVYRVGEGCGALGFLRRRRTRTWQDTLENARCRVWTVARPCPVVEVRQPVAPPVLLSGDPISNTAHAASRPKGLAALGEQFKRTTLTDRSRGV